MELKNISLKLKQSINKHNQDILDLPPDQIAFILRLYLESFNTYICYSNDQLDSSSESYISREELEKLREFYLELINNFFPMAHTRSPLRDLQIVNNSTHRQIEELLSQLHNEKDRLVQDSTLINTRFQRSVAKFADEFEQLLNP